MLRSAVASASRSASVCAAAAARSKHTVVLIRHGESVWNNENRFTGWVDVPLSEKGRKEAAAAGKLMLEAGLQFDVAHTSMLRRAITTLNIALEEMNQEWLPVSRSWRLNERSYGGLAGLNKAETAAKHGMAKVMEWRRSYAIPPPPVDKSSPYWPGNDRRYAHLSAAEIPFTESLKDTVARFLPYWNEVLAPTIRSGKRVVIAAHGNSLRALVKHLDNISDENIIPLNIPTGVPLVYTLDANLKPIPSPHAIAPLSGRYLGDIEKIKAEVQKVADQTKAKK
eukprot:a689086_53.p1 GENE.a689086_53~~a689086_53.p1  ORF type:complete len:292 (+),score=90.51 a689086_53:32-877(+)